MALCSPDDVITFGGLTDPDWELLEALVERASAVVEDYCGRSFELAEYDERYDIAADQSTLTLNNYPVTAVAALYDAVGEGRSERQVDSSQFILDPDAGLIRLMEGTFTPGRGSVRVVYTAGYATPPAPVVHAAVMLALGWYRERPDGRAVRESYDGYSASLAATTVPPEVAGLLEPYRRRPLA